MGLRLRRCLLLLLALCAVAASAASAGVLGSQYAERGRCGPYPRADVATPPWLCLGLVAGPQSGLVWPRSVLEVSPGRVLVSDAVGWSARGAGVIHEIMLDGHGGVRVQPLIEGRNLPHGLALGADGNVYVGDDDAIWRFDPKAEAPSPETLISGLPGKPSRLGDHWHPLKEIVFDREGALLVNFGAPRDTCDLGPKRERFPYPCPWSDGPKPDAAIWRMTLGGKGSAPQMVPFARGLRNSMALVVHPTSGLILQAENNFDRWGGRFDPAFPPEEFNVIEEGKHYGWPYCAADGALSSDYRGRASCSRYQAPIGLIPAHAAPLSMRFYAGAMFPELQGTLLVALHGMGGNGHRLVAYDVDAKGQPIVPTRKGKPQLPMAVVDGWDAKRGVRPQGRPSGIAVGQDGAIWIVDDKARVVLVALRPDAGARPLAPSAPEAAPIRGPVAGWQRFYTRGLKGACASCHQPFDRPTADAAWRSLVEQGFLDDGDVGQSLLLRALKGEGGAKKMPPEGSGADPAALAEALDTFLAGLGESK